MAQAHLRRALVSFAAAATAAVTALTLGLAPASAQGQWYDPATPQTPDSQVNISGAPFTGTAPDGTVQGYADLHTHLMSNEGFGGNIVCGKTYSANGIADALKDCDYHFPNGSGAVLENATNEEYGGDLIATHDPVGWPTFTDWPKWSSMTHQQMYYKWVERAWRGGLRVMVADAVNNNVFCQLPTQQAKYSCDDMDTVRRQIAETKKLQAFIDAQFGGAGKGWFRIAYSANEARSYIEQGKLAVILGVEVSNPFGCKLILGVPQCTNAQMTAGIDELYGLGVRSMFLCHKFDNALCGVRFDSGQQGVSVNLGNFLNTGQFWDVRHCDGPLTDNTVATGVIPSWMAPLFPLGVIVPIYPQGPHCNPKGLSSLGEQALYRMMERGMMVEVDHMSVAAATRTLDILEAASYPGVLSSHSWMAPSLTERIYRLGGMVAQYGHNADDFVHEMQDEAPLRTKYDVGYAFGMDMNGFGGTPEPRAGSSVKYPFATLGGAQASAQVTGQRTWNYNTDGVPHYGLIPDWVEDMRQLGGQGVVNELARGAESYLRTMKQAVAWDWPANLAAGKQVSASSTEWSWTGAYVPAKAVDGVWETRWASGWSDNQWLRVDLGAAKRIGRVAIHWENAYAKAYDVQVSTDGVTWRTAQAWTGADGGLDVSIFAPTDARYVRLALKQRGTIYGFSVRELVVGAR